MVISTELVTPEAAQAYLLKNSLNRPLSDKLVERYARDMREGKWKGSTSETIKFSKFGELLDGQHRLMAIIRSGLSFSFLMARDLDKDIFDVIDTGRIRTTRDIFGIERIKNWNQVPAIITLYVILKAGASLALGKRDVGITNSDILALYHKRPDFWQEVCRQSAVWYDAFSKVCSASFLGGFYCLFYDLNPTDATTFMEQLCSGINVDNNTIHLLRKRLIENRTGTKKHTRQYIRAVTIKAWNCFRDGREIGKLSFDKDREDYPVAS